MSDDLEIVDPRGDTESSEDFFNSSSGDEDLISLSIFVSACHHAIRVGLFELDEINKEIRDPNGGVERVQKVYKQVIRAIKYHGMHEDKIIFPIIKDDVALNILDLEHTRERRNAAKIKALFADYESMVEKGASEDDIGEIINSLEQALLTLTTLHSDHISKEERSLSAMLANMNNAKQRKITLACLEFKPEVFDDFMFKFVVERVLGDEREHLLEVLMNVLSDDEDRVAALQETYEAVLDDVGSKFETSAAGDAREHGILEGTTNFYFNAMLGPGGN